MCSKALGLQVLSTTIIAVRSLPLSRSTQNRVIRKVTCLHPVFGPPFTPYPLFQWYPQSKDILINFSVNC
jgi:hypothetical protein